MAAEEIKILVLSSLQWYLSKDFKTSLLFSNFTTFNKIVIPVYFSPMSSTFKKKILGEIIPGRKLQHGCCMILGFVCLYIYIWNNICSNERLTIGQPSLFSYQGRNMILPSLENCICINGFHMKQDDIDILTNKRCCCLKLLLQTLVYQ